MSALEERGPGPAEESAAVVIGAGPAGLAAAACLKRAGITPLILEQEGHVGSAWRRHYDRLHLHTSKRRSSLPHHPFPRATPTFPSRLQMVEYLEDYAQHFSLQPRFFTRVEWAGPLEGGWRVETNCGALQTPTLVVATGYNRVPYRPSVPGLESFSGDVLHSTDYKNGRAYAGRRVLVVGCGNSGAEIALDLAEHGAAPAMVVRRPIHVTPRRLFGQPVQHSSIRLGALPGPLADRLSLMAMRLVVGDLSPHGIELPHEGPRARALREGRVPLIDVGTVRAIKEGLIDVVRGVERIEGQRVFFDDGASDDFDVLLFATGYRTGLQQFLAGSEQLLDERGYPCSFGSEAAPGLFFIGYRNTLTGTLREIGIETKAMVRSVRRRAREAN